MVLNKDVSIKNIAFTDTNSVSHIFASTEYKVIIKNGGASNILISLDNDFNQDVWTLCQNDEILKFVIPSNCTLYLQCPSGSGSIDLLSWG